MVRTKERATRVFICIAIGAVVALANSFFDVLFYRSGLVSTAILLNDCVIGLMVAMLVYLGLAFQARKQERDVFLEKVEQNAVFRERNRLSREFHDNLAQSLTGVIMQLEADKTLDPRTGAGGHARALELARQGLRDTRRSLQGLRPELLEKKELTSAVKHLSDDVAAGTSLQVQTSFSGTVRLLSPAVDAALLRICQEALTNVVRHAEAHQVKIELCFGAEEVHLCVADDGRGLGSALPKDSRGLLFMAERAEELGGRCSVQSWSGRGTQIRVSIPIAPANHFMKGERPWRGIVSA